MIEVIKIGKKLEVRGNFAIYDTSAGDDEWKQRITNGGCGCCNDSDESIDCEQKAELLAAAPEMLEIIREIRKNGYHGNTWNTVSEMHDRFRHIELVEVN
jgi:hypothetical protein